MRRAVDEVRVVAGQVTAGGDMRGLGLIRGDGIMTAKLEQEVTKLTLGNHICLIYENSAEQMAAAVPFLKEGLARDERCLYIADDRTVEAVASALAATGVDVAHERKRVALWMQTKQDTYLKDGKFDPVTMIDFWRSAQTQALTDGFSGLRVAGEMTWALGSELVFDRLVEYEALLSDFLANSRSVILCQYDRSRFDSAVIHDVLHTHPIAVIGDLVCPNPYYEPAEFVLASEPTRSAEFKRKRVDWWIAHLKQTRIAEQEREQIQEKLKQSERRLAEAQQVAHIGSWERDLRTNQVTWSDELFRIFGLKAEGIDLSYEQFLNRLVPQDVDRLRAIVEEAIRERRHFSTDYRIVHGDGSVRVVHARGGVILDEASVPIRLIGTAHDVTELRQAEHALKQARQAHESYAVRLQSLSRRLLEVQETERRHLARELHDEVGQSVTGLRMLLKLDADSLTDAARIKLEQARGIIDELLGRIRRLSFDLRPAALDSLGLLPALLALFERYAEQTGVKVAFRHEGLEQRFPPEMETTAYRIVQEALTNVARHAGVDAVTVRVWSDANALSLQIEDQGCGFDPDVASRSPRSIGLAGMQERVMLLHGHLTIQSRPGAGTQLTAELPQRGQTLRETDDYLHRLGG
jgi:PAS domain S-box-containing protein